LVSALLWIGSSVVAGCGDGYEAPVPQSVAEGCMSADCHREVEQIHYGGPALRCVDCHGGDPDSLTKEGAHVTVDVSFNTSTPGSQLVDDPPLQVLDELPLDVIQFLNPADYRVAIRTCGSSIMAGGNCHTTITENSLLMNRATLVGTLAGGGHFAGTQDKAPRYGVFAAEDRWVPAEQPFGTVKKVERLPSAVPDHVTDPVARAFWPTFEQQCVECHVYRDGPKLPGRYYSSGCNACHMPTSDSSRAETADITQDRDELGHVRTHRLTNLIPDSQCARCHMSHLARSMLAQGLRERSEPEGDTLIGGPNHGVEDPEHHVPWPEENYVKYQGQRQLYGKPYPFYIADEDGRDEVDQTPPDIHTEKGLGCIDCHNIREAHGDKQMATRMDGETDVRCESCHGLPGKLASLQSDAGLAFSQSGTSVGGTGHNTDVFDLEPDGSVTQLGRFSHLRHPVTQITVRTVPNTDQFNARTRMGCELHAGTAEARAAVKQAVNTLTATDPDAVPEAFPGLTAGFAFDEVDDGRDAPLQCFTCHNSWTLNCYGCHMVRDDQQWYTSRITGEQRRGKVSNFGMSVVADALAMGFDTRGRIAPLVGTQVFFTHIDEQGQRVIDAQALRSADGMAGEGNVHNPVHHHTVRQQPRDCDGCHPSATNSHDVEAILRAVGLGTGRYTFTDGEGRVHWLDRLVEADYDGDGTPDDPAALGIPSSIFEAWRVVGSTHPPALEPDLAPPEPGPLDTATINRVLENVVVPQRTDEESRRRPDP